MAPGLVAVGAPTLRAIRATTPTPPAPRLAIAHRSRTTVMAGEPKMMTEVIRPWLLPAERPRQSGLIPDAVEHFPDTRGGDLVSGGRAEEPLPGRAESRARCLIADGQDLDDLRSQGQPAAAVALGPQHVDVPRVQVDPVGREQQGLPGPQTTRMHQGEERDGLPPPRGLGLKVCCGGEEPFDLL